MCTDGPVYGMEREILEEGVRCPLERMGGYVWLSIYVGL